MKHLIGAGTLLACIALASPATADEAPPPQRIPPTNVLTNDSRDWSQTRLEPKPALRDQVERTKAFLDAHESEIDEEIARLKTEGQIDRRSTSTLRSALNTARDTMKGMADGMSPEAERIDGWTARMIAYELGMAADALNQQADQIEAVLDTPPERSPEPKDGQSSEAEQRRHLVQTLKTTSSLLRSTAQAVSRNLK